MGFWKDIQAMSIGKLILLAILLMIFLDMTSYYINGFIGRTTEPYPLLFELIKGIHNLSIWKEIGNAGS